MFLLKVLDKIATKQFQKHLETNNLLHIQQSGFRSKHSTETALLDLQTNILEIIDKGKTGILILLDLSAAFDLIDHQTLTDRLSNDINCSPEASEWVLSFLTNRQSKVCWENAESPKEELLYGVPQGSCLSPALFNAYLVPLFNTLEQNGIKFTNYADDTQLLLELRGSYDTDAARIQDTYNLIKTWMDKHWMCLNGNKTELMIIGSAHLRKKLDNRYANFIIGDTVIKTVEKVKTLGVTLDSSLSMTHHTATLIRTSHYYLRLLRQIRPYLSEQNSIAIARATILPRLDYCNVLLANTSKTNLKKLQIIQNEAVRIAGQIPKRHHISEKRISMHWLPIEERIRFKVLTTTFKSLQGICPKYMENIFEPVSHAMNLRSNDKALLKCPNFNRAMGNVKSIICTGPQAWNTITTDLRKTKTLSLFKKNLKTLIFK